MEDINVIVSTADTANAIATTAATNINLSNIPPNKYLIKSPSLLVQPFFKNHIQVHKLKSAKPIPKQTPKILDASSFLNNINAISKPKIDNITPVINNLLIILFCMGFIPLFSVLFSTFFLSVLV